MGNFTRIAQRALSAIGDLVAVSRVGTLLGIAIVVVFLTAASVLAKPAKAGKPVRAGAAAQPASVAGKAVNVTGSVLVRNENNPTAKARQLKPGDVIREGEVINTASDASAKLLMEDKSLIDLGPTSLFTVDQFKQKGAVENRQVAMSMEYGKIRALVTKKIGDRGSFKVRTKAATMGVRGTEFLVTTDLVGVGDLIPGADPGAAGSKKEEAPVDGGKGGDKEKSGKPKSGSSTQITVIEGKVEVSTPTPKKEDADDGTVKSKKDQGDKVVALTAGEQLTAKVVETPKEEESDGGPRKPASIQVDEPVVKKLNTEEVKQVTQEVKVVDKTFTQAVVIDQNTGGSGFGGMETMAAINESLALPVDFVPTAATMNVPGTFSPNIGFQGNFYPGTIGRPVKVRVVFHR